MGGRNIIGVPDVPYSNSDSVVNKKYVDNVKSDLTVKVNKIIKIIGIIDSLDY